MDNILSKRKSSNELVGLIIGEDEQPDPFAGAGGGLDDEYTHWAETMLECGCTPVGNPFEPEESKTDEVELEECPYNICGGTRSFDSELGCNNCLCEYRDIDSNDYCEMEPGGTHDITQEQVDRWNEVVRQKVQTKQALQAKQEAVQATIYQEFEQLPVTSRRRRCFQTISRKGQPKMRQELLNEFFSTCPATGENNEEYLEAAHLVPFRDIQHCEPANGLLLDLKIHKALDSGHLTYDGNGQLWRRHNFNIQHLHICCAQLPSRLLTDKRKKWLGQAYRGWLKHHNTCGTELCKVITAVGRGELEKVEYIQ